MRFLFLIQNGMLLFNQPTNQLSMLDFVALEIKTFRIMLLDTDFSLNPEGNESKIIVSNIICIIVLPAKILSGHVGGMV